MAIKSLFEGFDPEKGGGKTRVESDPKYEQNKTKPRNTTGERLRSCAWVQLAGSLDNISESLIHSGPQFKLYLYAAILNKLSSIDMI